MKDIIVRLLNVRGDKEACDVSRLMDENHVAWNELGCNNWSAGFPYMPTVRFRIAHTGKAVLLQFCVAEETVRALAQDNGAVWEDSCCELFISLDGVTYYNIECNAAGFLRMKNGADRQSRTAAPDDAINRISRWSSLGREPFAEKEAPPEWQLALVIPLSSFFCNTEIEDLSGVTGRANFYKCGDALRHRHYVTWSPIDSEKPDFHQPRCFGKIYFE